MVSHGFSSVLSSWRSATCRTPPPPTGWTPPGVKEAAGRDDGIAAANPTPTPSARGARLPGRSPPVRRDALTTLTSVGPSCPLRGALSTSPAPSALGRPLAGLDRTVVSLTLRSRSAPGLASALQESKAELRLMELGCPEKRLEAPERRSSRELGAAIGLRSLSARRSPGPWDAKASPHSSPTTQSHLALSYPGPGAPDPFPGGQAPEGGDRLLNSRHAFQTPLGAFQPLSKGRDRVPCALSTLMEEGQTGLTL